MEDFGLRPVARADWSSGKPAIDPRKRRRQQDQADPNDEPVDRVEWASDEDASEDPPRGAGGE
jgi:hypothetical protein